MEVRQDVLLYDGDVRKRWRVGKRKDWSCGGGPPGFPPRAGVVEDGESQEVSAELPSWNLLSVGTGIKQYVPTVL